MRPFMDTEKRVSQSLPEMQADRLERKTKAYRFEAMSDDPKPPEKTYSPLIGMALAGFGRPFPLPHAPVKSKGHSKVDKSGLIHSRRQSKRKAT